MRDKKLCNQLNRIAYKSCISDHLITGDRKHVYDYWLFLVDAKRNCEAEGVQKALEFIDLIEELNGKN